MIQVKISSHLKAKYVKGERFNIPFGIGHVIGSKVADGLLKSDEKLTEGLLETPIAKKTAILILLANLMVGLLTCSIKKVQGVGVDQQVIEATESVWIIL